MERRRVISPNPLRVSLVSPSQAASPVVCRYEFLTNQYPDVKTQTKNEIYTRKRNNQCGCTVRYFLMGKKAFEGGQHVVQSKLSPNMHYTHRSTRAPWRQCCPSLLLVSVEPMETVAPCVIPTHRRYCVFSPFELQTSTSSFDKSRDITIHWGG